MANATKTTLSQAQVERLSDEALESAYDSDQIEKSLYKSELKRRARIEAEAKAKAEAEEAMGGLKPHLWRPKDKHGKPTGDVVVMLQAGKKSITWKSAKRIRESTTLAQYDTMSEAEIITALELEG